MPCRATFLMPRSKFGPGARYYLIAAFILIAGMVAAVVIYLNASDAGGDALAYEFADGTVYAVDPADSKMYRHQLERFGGKAAVFADDLNRWFSGLWRGKRLATTVMFLSFVVAFAVFRAGAKRGRGAADEDQR